MNLLKALAAVGSMTLISRILGFLRDTIIARVFGAGLYSDAFFVAFKIPNLLRRIFAEGAFSQAFVPILAEYKAKRGHDATRDLVDHVTTLLALILVVVTVIGVLAAPVLVYISAPGFSSEPSKFNLTIDLLRLTFPYIFFISLVALAGGILNTYSKFSVPAFTPTLLNLSFIGCALWLAPYFDPPVLALGVAVLLGGLLQLGFQLPYLAKIGMLPRFRLKFNDEGVWRILKLMGPAVFGVSIGQISLLINTIFASFMITGSVSWLYYADRLMEFPAGILGVALGTILLPSLAKHYADASTVEYSRLLDWGLRLTLMLALPAALALAILSVPLISTLFFYGKFTLTDLWMTREALLAYSLGLLGLIMVKVLAPGFYARQNIRTPVKIALFTLFSTQMMNIVFVFILDLKHAGLALSIGLGACLNAGLLFYHLRQHDIYHPQPGWLKFFLQVAAALAVMGGVLWFAMGAEESWLKGGIVSRVVHLGWTVLAGAAAYFAALTLFGVRIKDFIHHGAK
ncbi:MAG: murein biosynthesis integral membrane protein MurJ [Gammaproteobacteria bacterium]|nr:murein biosynthesis integral membrane protein MurJ [Gammaproteobacteria bacterium]MBU1978650.1 murein biosynthesis integral membrane protein MurJ [Gammaproteobacteria bacterium]